MQRLLRPFGRLDDDRFLCSRFPNANDRGVQMKRDALTRQDAHHRLGHILVFLAQNLRSHVHHRHRAAQARESLGHLDADGTAPQYGQGRRQPIHIENVAIGQMIGFPQTVDRGDNG